jgi:hypothetical protein
MFSEEGSVRSSCRHVPPARASSNGLHLLLEPLSPCTIARVASDAKVLQQREKTRDCRQRHADLMLHALMPNAPRPT